MAKKQPGFTMVELIITVAIIGVIAAFALPSALSSIQNYRVHSDASATASFLNITRMRAASQYTPYALDFDPTQTPPTYVIEKLTAVVYNPLAPAAVTYVSRSPQVFEIGTQYATQGDTFTPCLPSGVGGVYPGPITANPATCTGTFQFCFNTRGMPVQCAGSSPGTPLTNGGEAVYIQNPSGITDAVILAVGGVVQVWSWDSVAAKWSLR
jgi:prepilin-type N-terminal cleavage/methylation domain-containing protein